MATRKYKTLKGLLSQNGGQLGYNDFHRNQFYHKTAGWQNFSLPEEEKEKGYIMLASAIYTDGKKMSYRLRNYNGRAAGILNRIFFERNGKRATYCAGQDYPGEIRFIQKLFRDN